MRAIKSNYKKHKHLAKENFSENELEVEENQEKVFSCSLSVGTKQSTGNLFGESRKQE